MLNSLILVSVQVKNYSLSNKETMKFKMESLKIFDDITHYVEIRNLRYNYSTKPLSKDPQFVKSHDIKLEENIVKEVKDSKHDSIGIPLQKNNSNKNDYGVFKYKDSDSINNFDKKSSSKNNIFYNPNAFNKNLNLLIDFIQVKINTNLLSRVMFIKNRITDNFMSLFDPSAPFKQSKGTVSFNWSEISDAEYFFRDSDVRINKLSVSVSPSFTFDETFTINLDNLFSKLNQSLYQMEIPKITGKQHVSIVLTKKSCSRISGNE